MKWYCFTRVVDGAPDAPLIVGHGKVTYTTVDSRGLVLLSLDNGVTEGVRESLVEVLTMLDHGAPCASLSEAHSKWAQRLAKKK